MLEKINNPNDIKNLNTAQMEELAGEIRQFLINKVSKTGGHLASNLGVVELTLSLHKVFDAPKDKIIWDVGHQVYVHKILTGRQGGFDNLRKLDGMSGFPKRSESLYDTYDSGHSSTSISAAIGMANARDILKEDYEVIAVIGDGSLTGGPAFEGLNNLGDMGTRVIVILNDNGMSISKNIGGLSEHLGKLRTSSKYISAKEKVKDTLDKIPVVGSGLKFFIGDTKTKIKYAILNGGALFEELGMTYLGPIDGHDLDSVIETLNQAKNTDGPVLIHLITQKGRGYGPAEKNPDKFHGIGPFDPETGKGLSGNKATYSDLFGDAMVELAEKDEKITGITAAMKEATGLGLMGDKYPDRIFDVGIAEANAVIVAAGQALSGLHPVVCVYSSFLQRAYDEIMLDVCMQNLPVIFAVDRAGIVGADGETHQGIFDLSYFMSMPNMTVLTPCDGIQLKEMLEYAATLNSPCAIRYPRGEAIVKSLTGERFNGRNIKLKSGKDGEILAVGTMLQGAIEASEILASKGYDFGIVNVGIVKSRDVNENESYLDLTQNTETDKPQNKLYVTVEDNVKTGGFGEKFIINNPELNVLNIGWPEKFIEQGSTKELFLRYKMDAAGIADRILDSLERSNSVKR